MIEIPQDPVAAEEPHPTQLVIGQSRMSLIMERTTVRFTTADTAAGQSGLRVVQMSLPLVRVFVQGPANHMDVNVVAVLSGFRLDYPPLGSGLWGNVGYQLVHISGVNTRVPDPDPPTNDPTLHVEFAVYVQMGNTTGYGAIPYEGEVDVIVIADVP